MKQSYSHPGPIFRLQPFRLTTALFFLFFLLNFFVGFGQEVTNPSLIHDDKIDIDEVNISAFDLSNLESKANRLVISTDFNSKGEKFVLTFGNGIQKVVADNDTEDIIPGNLLFSPLDFAIDSQDRFYVANAASNNRKILVFDSEGTPLPSETIGSGAYGEGANQFKGPTGLAFDSNDNLYIADNYSGDDPEASERGHVKVFFTNGDFTEFHNVSGDSLNYPYRIAANSNGRIFLSEVGPNNGRVQVIDLDSNLNPVRIDILEGSENNIGSPGDIIVDNEDLIYIADFGDEVSLKTILEARNEPLNLLGAIGDIQNGIEEEIFRIRVYEKNLSYKGYILDEIDLPVDLAFGACGKLSVNNLNVTGGLFSGYNFDFDLEIYSRTPYLDTELPIAKCIPSGKEFILQNGKVVLTPEDINDGSYDNCGIDSMELARSEFDTPGTHTVSLTVTDEAGNFAICATNIEIVEGDSQGPSVTCPGNSVLDELELGENCNYTLPEMEQYIETENFQSEEFSVVDENINDNILTVEVEVLDGEELIETCELRFELVDETPPTINCPENITREIPAGEDSITINYDLPEISDNCSENLTPVLLDGPVSGSDFSEGVYTIEYEVTDDADITATCSFTITVNSADSEAPEIECLNYEVFLDENGQASLDPETIYNGERDDLILSLNKEEFDCSNLGTNTVTLTATDPNTNLSSTCTAQVEVFDGIAPIANCVDPGREFQLQNGSVTISPSAIDLNSGDNCEITRSLSEDTFTTTGTKNIILYVEDLAGNTAQCTTSIEIIAEDAEPAEPDYQCFQGDIPDIRLDEDCEFAVPDYSYLIETQNFTPRFEQEYQQFDNIILTNIQVFNQETGELVGECSFSSRVVDLTPPTISCPANQIENFDPDTGFVVPDYESWANFSDNCGEVSFRQEPEAGEIIYESTTVNLFAVDSNEQEASCSFKLQLTESDVLNIFCQIDQNVTPDEDCSFTLPDYRDTASVSFSDTNITQTPPEGTVITENTQIKLTASLDGETDECYFMVNLVDAEDPVASCISGFVVNLDHNGNASIDPEDLDNNSTDNCGIVSMALSQTDFTRADIGEVPITLTVRDDAGNMDSCDTIIEVVDGASGEFQCRENVVLNLGENGEASLNPQDLYTGDASGLNLEASRLDFNCSDLGMEEIELDYSGEQTGSCIINVEVRDEISPVSITGIVELTLNNSGFAYLGENDVLAEDNCSGELIYRFGKSIFTCKNVGTNTVNVEIEDASGNVAERNIQVRISGEACEFPEIGEDEFLFLYPNPSNGVFTIATPEGMFIERVRVFDSRGRYLLEQDYNANARFYRMTIQGVEESVYTLQIFTNEGVIVKRAIIKR